jgi:hypothetical protein
MSDYYLNDLKCEDVQKFFSDPYERYSSVKTNCSTDTISRAKTAKEMEGCSDGSLLDYIESNRMYELTKNPKAYTDRKQMENIILDNKCHIDDVWGRSRVQLQKCPKTTIQSWILKYLPGYSHEILEKTKDVLIDIVLDNRDYPEDHIRYSEIGEMVKRGYENSIYATFDKNQVVAFVSDSLTCTKIKDGGRIVNIGKLSRSKLLDVVRAIATNNRAYLNQHAVCEEQRSEFYIPTLGDAKMIPSDRQQLEEFLSELTMLKEDAIKKQLVLRALEIDRKDPNRDMSLDAPYLDTLIVAKELQYKAITEQFKNILDEYKKLLESARKSAKFVYSCQNTSIEERLELILYNRDLADLVKRVKVTMKGIECEDEANTTCNRIKHILGNLSEERTPEDVMRTISEMVDILNELIILLRNTAESLSGIDKVDKPDYQQNIKKLFEFAEEYMKSKNEFEKLRSQVRNLKKRVARKQKSLHGNRRVYRDGYEDGLFFDYGKGPEKINKTAADVMLQRGKTVYIASNKMLTRYSGSKSEEVGSSKYEYVPTELLDATNRKLNELLANVSRVVQRAKTELRTSGADEDKLGKITAQFGQTIAKLYKDTKVYPGRTGDDETLQYYDETNKKNKLLYNVDNNRFSQANISDYLSDINRYYNYETGIISYDVNESNRIKGSLFFIKGISEKMGSNNTACRLGEAEYGQPYTIKPCTSRDAVGRTNFTVTEFDANNPTRIPIFTIFDPRRNSLWILVTHDKGIDENTKTDNIEKIKKYFGTKIFVETDVYRERDTREYLNRYRNSGKLIQSGRDIYLDITAIDFDCSNDGYCPYEAIYFVLIKLINPDHTYLETYNTTKEAFKDDVTITKTANDMSKGLRGVIDTARNKYGLEKYTYIEENSSEEFSDSGDLT